MLPKVAVIGRPNVGKSTLFNALTKSRSSLVRDEEGVTRDIQNQRVEWLDLEFELFDTGGITNRQDVFSPMIKAKIERILPEMDLILFVVDGRVGICPEDKEVLKWLKLSQKKFLVLVNKVDRIQDDEIAKADFYVWGAEILSCAFEHARGITETLEWIRDNLPKVDVEKKIKPDFSLCILGKPNAGKSSLCNRLLKDERLLVSEIAGTTTDSVDLEFEHEGEKYHLIDTAGLRRKKNKSNDLEKISAVKSLQSIERADLILLLVDALEGPSEQEARLVERILDAEKCVLLVGNKLDLSSETSEFRKKFRQKTKEVFHFFADIPLVFVSAKTGKGIDKLWEAIYLMRQKMHTKIPTSELNRFFHEVIRKAPAPVSGTKDVKFYYLTQTKQVPPSFIAFANHPDGVNPGYRRFLSKRIKKQWGLEGLPIRIYAMKQGGGKSQKAKSKVNP